MDDEIIDLLNSFPPMKLTSVSTTTDYEPPAPDSEISLWEEESSCRAPQLAEFWRTARSARLCYAEGSSGLSLLSPPNSIDETRKDREVDEDWYHEPDVVIGVFEESSDLIIWSPEEQRILWSGPIDSREDWPRFNNIAALLVEYRRYQYS